VIVLWGGGVGARAGGWLAPAAEGSKGAGQPGGHEHLSRTGVLATARVTGISDTPVFVNDQQMIEVDLRIEPPGMPAFADRQTMVSSPTRMQTLTGHRLVVLVEPGTTNYEIDWNASALVAGVIPAEFTIAEDGITYDLTGRGEPLLRILNVLHHNRIPLDAAVDIRSNPVVREQVSAIVRAAAADAGEPPPVPTASAGLTVSQRLQQLDVLRATGAVTPDEYAAKRQQILADL
ncbi:MAG: SHOCT domain-containing protein, partial [Mycobacterium sp.]|nr:SHOCT domain-containing protein [Mycobacterium sp.]